MRPYRVTACWLPGWLMLALTGGGVVAAGGGDGLRYGSNTGHGGMSHLLRTVYDLCVC